MRLLKSDNHEIRHGQIAVPRPTAPSAVWSAHHGFAMTVLAKIVGRVGKTGTASERAYAVLREAILSNVLVPGTRLLADELANQLGVSRTPVREALRQLQAEDLVSVDAGNALTVKVLSEQQLLEIYHTREALEGMAARLAAETAGQIDILNLHTVLQDVEAAFSQSNLAQLRTYAGDFQLAVFKAAHNQVLFKLLTALREQVRNQRRTTMSVPGRDQETVVFCHELMKAIKSRDPDAAERIARANRRRTLELRIKMLRTASREHR